MKVKQQKKICHTYTDHKKAKVALLYQIINFTKHEKLHLIIINESFRPKVIKILKVYAPKNRGPGYIYKAKPDRNIRENRKIPNVS